MKSGRQPPVEDRENSNERWLVSYADFITLMFAFFAVLYATSQKDMNKAKEFQESIKRYLIKAGAFGESGQQINQGIKNNSPIEPPIETFNSDKLVSAQALDEAEIFVEKNLTKAERDKYIVDVAADDWGVRITVSSPAIFAAQSDKFRAEAMPFIAKLSDLVAQTKRKLLIEGHVAPNEVGPYKTTWDFASARSVNLLRFIQKKEKLPADRLASASLADSRPLFTKDKKAQNSRLELILLNPDYEF